MLVVVDFSLSNGELLFQKSDFPVDEFCFAEKGLNFLTIGVAAVGEE